MLIKSTKCNDTVHEGAVTRHIHDIWCHVSTLRHWKQVKTGWKDVSYACIWMRDLMSHGYILIISYSPICGCHIINIFSFYLTPLKDAYAAYAWESTIKEMFNALFLWVWSIKIGAKALNSWHWIIQTLTCCSFQTCTDQTPFDRSRCAVLAVVWQSPVVAHCDTHRNTCTAQTNAVT